LKKAFLKFVATSGYLGLIPGAPGTYGAILGCILYALLSLFVNFDIDIILIVLIIVFTIIGTIACAEFEEEWGHDPSRVVMDETVGQWITLLFIPFDLKLVIIGLILFRFFDILKPLGIRAIDKNMKHPFSVMLDDILAGIYALVCMQVIVKFWYPF